MPQPFSSSLASRWGTGGAIAALLAIAVTVAILVQLESIQDESDRVLDETREDQVCAAARVDFAKLEVLLRGLGVDPAHVEEFKPQALSLMQQVQFKLGEFHSGSELAGRGEPDHEAAEANQVNAIQAGVVELKEMLMATTPQALFAGRDAVIDRVNVLFTELTQVIRDETDAARADLRHHLSTIAFVMKLATLSSLVLLAFILWSLQRQIVSPLRSMQRAVERFGEGDLAHRLEIRAPNELGALARTFNQMAASLFESQRQLADLLEQRTQQFKHAAKLADVGTFAAGVAHEINTPIASVASCAEGLERKLQRGPVPEAEILDYLRTISGEAHRTSELAARLLSFARRAPAEVRPVRIDELIHTVQRLVAHRSSQKRLTVQIDQPTPPLPAMRLPAAEIEQVLLNLLQNAIDASPENGTITVTIGAASPGVWITVADEGPGVPAEYVDRVFEPFFTTKESGKGTGLGLSLTAMIVEGLGGRIEYRPGAVRGAVFELRLPVAGEGNA
ncbi:MAG: ATP-binding protein [Acidobacteriota bacterium]